MRRNSIFYLLFILLLVGLFIYQESSKPQKIDWSETYNVSDKIPYGTYILHQMLPSLFPGGEVRISGDPVKETLSRIDKEKMTAYIFINRRFSPGESNINRLLDWVESGNYLFVAAEFMADTLLSVLKIEQTIDLFPGANLLIDGQHPSKSYLFQKNYSYFRIEDGNCQTDTLGIHAASAHPDYIKVAYGKGYVYLNLIPQAFANYRITDSLTSDYSYKALSFLPPDLDVILDNYHPGEDKQGSIVGVLLQYPAMKWAWFLLLLSGLIYLLFKVKREQRAIPVIRSPENKILEFLYDISLLYYRQHNHKAIAIRYIEVFENTLGRKYHIFRITWGDKDKELLALHSGVSMDIVERLSVLIANIRNADKVSKKNLSDLSDLTKEFKIKN